MTKIKKSYIIYIRSLSERDLDSELITLFNSKFSDVSTLKTLLETSFNRYKITAQIFVEPPYKIDYYQSTVETDTSKKVVKNSNQYLTSTTQKYNLTLDIHLYKDVQEEIESVNQEDNYDLEY